MEKKDKDRDPLKDKKNENKTDHGTDSPNRNEKRKPRYTAMLLILAVTFIVLYSVINFDSISGFISSIVSVLTPIILGFAIAYILNPIMRFIEIRILKGMRNKKLLRAISLTSTYLFALVFIGALLMLILPELIESISGLGSHLNEYIDDTIANINGLIADYFGTHNVPETINKEQLLSAVATFFTESGDFFQMIGTYIIEYGKGLVIGVKNAVLGIFISIYVLASKERLTSQVNKIASAILTKENKHTLYRYIRICDNTFGGFLIGKIIDSIIIGIITLVVLMIFDIPYEILVSAIVCVTNIIPVFGPFIGAIPSFFIIFIVDPTKAFIFLVLILLIQQLDGNVIGPKILGNKTGMSALGVIIAIIIMGDYFGVIGMILGVPIFAVALTIINELVENKLRKKNLPVNSAEYYPENSVIDPYEDREVGEPYFNIFAISGHLFGKIMKLIFRKEEDKKPKKAKAEKANKKNKEEKNENE